MVSARVRNAVSIVLLAFVGAVFLVKYAARYVDVYLLLGGLYVGGFASVFLALRSVQLERYRLLNGKTFAATLVVFAAALAVLIIVLPEASRVGRFIALKEWIGDLFGGRFPYNASTKPSGLPFLFVLVMPFYLIGNLGYLEVAGLLLFGAALMAHRARLADRWSGLALLLLMPPFWYEVLTRSELFFNMVLVLFLIIVAERYVAPHRVDTAFLVLAVSFGLVVSTRTIVTCVYLLYVVFRFRESLRNGILFFAVGVAAFALTLVPFVLWDAQRFIEAGPFRMQFRYAPLWLAGAFAAVSVWLGWKARNLDDVLFFAGVVPFAIVATPFAATLVERGFHGTIIEDNFDVAYFIFALPFLLLSLGGDGKQASSG